MELQHVNVKIYCEGDLKVDPVRFVEVFHRWIQEQALDDLLIDVADYRHVPAGPSVLLVGQTGDYCMDNAGNRYGLRYNRKASLNGSNEDRFRQALRSVLTACQLLEADFATAGARFESRTSDFANDGPLKFSRQEFDLFINDRALAPNTPETFADCIPELEDFLVNVLGHTEFNLVHRGDPRSRFGITVTLARPFDLASLLRLL